MTESFRTPASSQELRKTCDNCRKRKIKCSNENPCARCRKFGLSCQYSPTCPIGRPSKRQDTLPSDLSSVSGPQSSISLRRNELAWVESLEMPGNLTDAMTLDTLGAPITFQTPPDELSWPEWSALDTIRNTVHSVDGSFLDQLPQIREEPHVADNVNEAYEPSPPHQHTDSNTQCQCGELVRHHMNNKKRDIDDLSEFIAALRGSKDLAQQVLSCTGCGNLDGLPSQVAGNVLLFGAVMMDATSSFQSFIRDQEQRALTSPDEQCATQIYLASKYPNTQHIEFQLERHYAWPLAKVLLRVEVDQLRHIGISFVNRQWRVHEKGHEACLDGERCRKHTPTQSYYSSPADFCPRSIEPTSFFNCFRTAKHLQYLIEGIQKDLE